KRSSPSACDLCTCWSAGRRADCQQDSDPPNRLTVLSDHGRMVMRSHLVVLESSIAATRWPVQLDLVRPSRCRPAAVYVTVARAVCNCLPHLDQFSLWAIDLQLSLLTWIFSF